MKCVYSILSYKVLVLSRIRRYLILTHRNIKAKYVYAWNYFILDPDHGEFGEYFEGDMILDAEQKRAVSEATDARNGLKGGAKRWPNRTVVYHLKEGDFG